MLFKRSHKTADFRLTQLWVMLSDKHDHMQAMLSDEKLSYKFIFASLSRNKHLTLEVTSQTETKLHHSCQKLLIYLLLLLSQIDEDLRNLR
jgi:hypothetical protein